jgi:hypothetical protein
MQVAARWGWAINAIREVAKQELNGPPGSFGIYLGYVQQKAGDDVTVIMTWKSWMTILVLENTKAQTSHVGGIVGVWQIQRFTRDAIKRWKAAEARNG